MAIAGVIAFAWTSGRPVPNSSPFSRIGRVLLSAAAVPVIFLVVTVFINLVPSKGNPTEYLELIAPESRRFTVDDQTLIAVDDGLRTHYVFYFEKNITSVSGMSEGGGRNERQKWSRSGTLALPSGQRIEYARSSSKLDELSIDGRTWDLKNGAFFQVEEDGSVVQHSIYPPLLREENVEEWIESIHG
jgi:hypothetical protein